MDNSNRREYGVGVVGRLLNRRVKEDLTQEQLVAMDHVDDNRPFFTYWVTTVQILILIISLCAYGFASPGFGNNLISGLVFVPSLSLQQVDYYEPENFWFGPRAVRIEYDII